MHFLKRISLMLVIVVTGVLLTAFILTSAEGMAFAAGAKTAGHDAAFLRMNLPGPEAAAVTDWPESTAVFASRYYPERNASILAPLNGGSYIQVVYAHDWVGGYLTPTSMIYITVAHGAGGFSTSSGEPNTEGFFDTNMWGWDGEHPDIAPGDIVTASWAFGADRIVNPVGEINGEIDFENNLITGTVAADGFNNGNVSCDVWGEETGVFTQAIGTDFVCDFNLVGGNLNENQTIALSYLNSNGDWVTNVYDPPRMHVNYGHDWVEVYALPEVIVYLTVTESSGTPKGVLSGTTHLDGRFSTEEFEWPGGHPDIQPGDHVTATWEGGMREVVPIALIESEVDYEADLLTGTLYADWFTPTLLNAWCSGQEEGAPHIDVEGVNPEGGTFTCDFGAAGWDIYSRGSFNVGYYEPDGDQVSDSFALPRMDVNYAHDWIEGMFDSRTTVFITVTDGGGGLWTMNGETDADGWFSTNEWPWDGDNQPDIAPGQIITAAWEGGMRMVNPVGSINAEINFDADLITGTVDAPFDSVPVACEVWEESGEGVYLDPVTADGGTEFYCDFSGYFDLDPGQQIAFRYYEPDGDSIINMYNPPWVRVNYAHDWVGANYDLGHTFWFTVTESDGSTVKGYGQTETWPGGGWGGHGFETLEEHWDGSSPPDILPGDWVYFVASDGYTNTVHVGEITGTIDLALNGITGTIYVPEFSENLPIECHPWGADASVQESSVAPNNTLPPYSCVWDPGEYTIGPGEDIAVMYLEPDQDRVINVFRIASPDVGVEKWAPNTDQVGSEGYMVFDVRVFNEGDAPAESVILTDTLPVDSFYVGDNSGFSSTSENGMVVWDIGTLEPGEEIYFSIFMTNSTEPGSELVNMIDVFDPADTNPDNDHSEATVFVVPEVPDLDLGKQPRLDNPAPGQTILWEIYVNNTASVPSGPVYLTDTLPANTTVVGWYAEGEPWRWTQVFSSSTELVLYADFLPGYWGDRIFLQLRLDEGLEIGTELHNSAEIATVGETNLDNNYAEAWAWVSEPFAGVSLHKSFSWGQLVPGGSVEYNLTIRNDGNIATSAWITDTLPEGTTFYTAYLEQTGWAVFPPDLTEEGTLAWFFENIEPGERWSFVIELNISDTLSAGSVIENCAEIVIPHEDFWLDDNFSCWTEVINDPGPNLRVTKEGWWNDEEQTQLGYRIQVDNLGTENLGWTTLTDTLPLSTTFFGDWWPEYWDQIDIFTTTDSISWSVIDIPVNTSFNIYFNLNIDEALHGQVGQEFTNTVEIHAPGDVNPEDNIFTNTTSIESQTNVDVGVEKWHASHNEVGAGGYMQFTIHLFNQGDTPAENVVLTDTLPENSAYIWDSSGFQWSSPSPSQVVWDIGTLEPGEDYYFGVVMTNSVAAGELLTNSVQVFAQEDQNPDNDYSEMTVSVIDAVPDLYVNKDPNPWNPAAGQTMLWVIHYGNNSPVPSGPAVLTDTLPEGTTVIEWWSGLPAGFWTESLSTTEQLVLEMSSLPGYWGDDLYIRLLLDEVLETDTLITNTIEIFTEGEENLEDNYFESTVSVWDPVPSVTINKNLNWAELVPGGMLEYHFFFQNSGNIATPVWVTDTLPEGTVFFEAYLEQAGWSVFTPTVTGDGFLSWYIDNLEPGDWLDIDVQLWISDTLDYGTVLENCVEIAIPYEDQWPSDNVHCVYEELNEPGPNLRVTKNAWWNSESQISYSIRVENIGTEHITNITITDTLPMSTTFNGETWWDYWDEVNFVTTTDQLTWSIPELQPTGQLWINFNVDIDEPAIGEAGRDFVNLVEVTNREDVNPLDNHHAITMTNGLDIQCNFPWDSELNFGNVYITIMPEGPGDLFCIDVIQHNTDHPNATQGLDTGTYWTINGLDRNGEPASNFTVTLTIRAPFGATDGNDKLCRFTGSGWDCSTDGFVDDFVWRNGVTQFSDWVVGNDVGPTVMQITSFSAKSPRVSALWMIVFAGLTVVFGWRYLLARYTRLRKE